MSATHVAPTHAIATATALALVYLVWGSTYLGIRFALESFTPTGLGAVRFLAAGIAFYGFLRLRGRPAPTPLQWRNAAITGLLLLGTANTLVAIAQQTVASGIAAVAVASMPLWAALFAGIYGQWPHRRDGLGLAIGFVGVVLLNLDGDLRASPTGAIALLLAPVAWAFGSVWSRRQDLPGPLMNTAVQMLVAGVALLVLSIGLGSLPTRAPTPRAGFALMYLVVFGSIVAFSAYVWLLQHVRPALATSYAYVNPPIALLLGALLAGERITLLDGIASTVIVLGVALVVMRRDSTPVAS